MSAPGIVAIRAVHQYRRRDILTYVALRQVLASVAARRDRWSQEIATALVLERAEGGYHAVPTFKEVKPDGSIEFRQLMLPAPHEVLAEASLLSQCAIAGGKFARHPNVYSYRLSEGNEARGIFQPYFRGYAERQSDIAAACRAAPGSVVLHADIRKFYPTITVTVARDAWDRASQSSSLPAAQQRLGQKLLSDHARAAKGGEAILTGPMFSHLIGNLVFRDIDDEFGATAGVRYFRYVDDITLVGPQRRVADVEALLAERLGELGFRLHPEKRLEVPAAQWIATSPLLAEESVPSWKTFIGKLKQVLMLYPDLREPLAQSFQQNGIRIRPLDYSEAEQERPYLDRMALLAHRLWFRRKMRALRAREVLDEALALRGRYANALAAYATRVNQLEGIERKRVIQHIRYLTSRLVYLAAPDTLGVIEESISGVPELAMIATAYYCVRTRDVTPLLRFGPAAAQAAAQPLRALGGLLQCRPVPWTEATVQAYAIFRLNGLDLGPLPADMPVTSLLLFCDWSESSSALLDDRDAYFREIGCIHGVDRPDFNQWALETAFDRDDDLVFDMQTLMEGSS